MSGGGSLGLRSGSYGSLQQQQHPHPHYLGGGGGGGIGGGGNSVGGTNGSPSNSSPGGPGVGGGGVALSIQVSASGGGSAGRKNSKALGSREKERRMCRICKVVSRRKVGMLLLLVASAAVLISFIPALTRGFTSPSATM